jgi:hypothetical protein
MTEIKKLRTSWYQNSEQDWALIMATETDRTLSEIEYDGMGFPLSVRPEDAAMKVMKDLIKGLILKPTGSSKWIKRVEKNFHDVYSLSRDYILQAELRGIVPKVYTINNLI